MRIGLFGGTFDPIHIAHLIVAETVRSDFSLDRIFFIPAALPPHKGRKRLTPIRARLEMLHLAVEGQSGFFVSDVEMQRGEVSYTIDTVRWFQEREEWAGDDFYLILGGDSLLELGTWKDPEQILDTIPILVVRRPGFDMDRVEERFLKRVVFVNAPFVAISSTEIRQRVHEGKSIRYWVPDKVEAYIRREGLYL